MGICWYSSKANSKLLLERLIYHPDYLQRLRWMQIPGLLFLRHFVFFFFSHNTFQKTFWSYQRIFKCTLANSDTLFNAKGKKHVPRWSCLLIGRKCGENCLGLIGMYLIRARSSWSCKLFKKELQIFNANKRLPKNPWSLIVHGLYFSSSNNVSSIRCIH